LQRNTDFDCISMDTLKDLAQDMGIAAASGIGLGTLLNKSGLGKPKFVRKQMRLESMTVAKTALTALTTSSLVACVGNALGIHAPILYPKLTVKPVDVIGGAILGVGLHFTGGTPETVLIQAASGKQTALWTLLGEMVGALGYGLLHPVIWGKSFDLDLPGGKAHIVLEKDLSNGILDASVLKVAIPLAVLLAGGLYVLEEIFPEESHRPSPEEVSFKNPVFNKRWSPYICGTLMGLLQVPTLVLTGVGLSSSSSYITLAAHLVNLFTTPNDYLLAHMNNPRYYLQILFHLSLAVGGYFASSFLIPEQKTKKPVKPLTMKQKILAFIGGIALIVGTRLTDRSVPGARQIIATSFTSLGLAYASGILASYIIPKYLTAE